MALKYVYIVFSTRSGDMDPTYPLVPIANFICLFLVTLALFVTAGRPWNIGVCMFAIWTALSCLITGVNTILWRDNFDNVAPVWCDICE